MINRLVDILKSQPKLAGWKINYHQIEAKEIFMIRHSIEMNRGKEIENCKLTVYRDFEIDGVKYRGSSDVNIYPTMLENEIREAIDGAFYASGFVKNKFFPLVEKKDFVESLPVGNLKDYDFDTLLKEIVDAILIADHYKDGYVNSFEVFLNKDFTRILTSTGIDYKATSYNGVLEFITTFKGEKEEIELFDFSNFASFNKEQFTKRVEEQILISKDRSIAKPTPDLGKFEIITKDDSVRQILDFFAVQTEVNSVYQKVSQAKLNEYFQKQEAACDKITLHKEPFLVNSTRSLPFDNDGVILQSQTVIEDGKILKYHGSNRISHYLGIEPTGVIANNRFEKGKQSVTEFKKSPYLEVVSFSSLQVDEMVGTFGGEIRLAYYYDGNTITPVYGGSVNGNLLELLNELYLSSETVSLNEYEGPKYLKVKMMVAGNN